LDSQHEGHDTQGTASLAHLEGKRETFQRDYERHLQAIEAIEPGQLLPINVDIVGAVIRTLGCVRALGQLREQAARLPDISMASYDALGEYAGALLHASALYRITKGPPASLPQLSAEGKRLRAVLFSDLSSLARHGFVSQEQIKKLRWQNGHLRLATSLLGISAVLRGLWNKIAGKTAVTPEELSRAEHLADEILRAVGARKHKVPTVVEATRRRQQAFTLFARAHDQARRAVVFLRWKEKDADRLFPPLHAKKKAHRHRVPPTLPSAPPTLLSAPPTPAADPPR
jgi:hypothetical protein